MTWLRRAAIAVGGFVALIIAVWVARVPLLQMAARLYLEAQGVVSDVEVRNFDFGGATLRLRLGGADAPAITADAIRVVLEGGPMPRVSAVVVTRPVIRARLGADGTITLPQLQDWIERLRNSAGGHSRFVSDDLVVTLEAARVLLETPYGAAEIDGDARLEHGRPVTLAGRLLPTTLRLNGRTIRLGGAVSAQARAGGYDARGEFAVDDDAVSLRGGATLVGLHWTSGNGVTVAATSAEIAVSQAAIRTAELAATDGMLRLSLKAPTAAAGADGKLSGQTDVVMQASAQVPADRTRALLARLPGVDKALLNALIGAASGTVSLTMEAHVAARDGLFGVALQRPARVTGGNGAVLDVAALDVSGLPQAATGSVALTLAGPGLPRVAAQSSRFQWTPERSQADLELSLQGSYGPLRAAAVEAAAHVAVAGETMRVSLTRCASLRVAQVTGGGRAAAANVRARLCPSGAQPLILRDGAGWSAAARVQEAAAEIASANATLGGASGIVALRGGSQAQSGTISFAVARVTDRTGKRFAALSATGTAVLTHGVVRGRAMVREARGGIAIGTADFSHSLASGAGAAQLHVAKLAFADGKLQPKDLSPLLAPVQRADGAVAFEGTVAWSRKGLSSQGRLTLQDVAFRTPLGMAHGVNGTIALSSLLPPRSLPGQTLTAAKVDWTLPLTALSARFAVGPDAVTIEAARTAIAGGTLALDAFTLPLSGSAAIGTTARLDGIDLAELVTATNVGEKVKLTGRVSGTVPFALADGNFRIAKGHLQSDGAGRLEVNRTVWTKGTVASGGSIQDFAYQALEHLAFDSLTAELNSVANGRLSVLFHIKGKSDPPTHQEAHIGLFDLINGNAFAKPIDLPSGTAVDLTLDTSLNFDELLRSYRTAWPGGGTPSAPAQPGGLK
ncbi:MAG: YdbH domain-containing protein [Rhizomicrobium sp.]